MPDKKSLFAEVTRKSKEKRTAANNKTAARKTAELTEDADRVAARALREAGPPGKTKVNDLVP